MAVVSYLAGWKKAKDQFEAATKRKKPSDTVMGVFKKSSGLTPAFTAMDKAVDANDKEEFRKTLKEARKVAETYGVLVKAAAAKEPDRAIKSELENLVDEIGNLLQQGEASIAAIGKLPTLNSIGDFAKLMKNPKDSQQLVDAAKREHSDENIEFLQAMVKKDRSKTVYTTFIDDDGKKSINISGPVRKSFNPTKAKDVTPEMLKAGDWDGATKEILALLNRDTISRLNAK